MIRRYRLWRVNRRLRELGLTAPTWVLPATENDFMKNLEVIRASDELRDAIVKRLGAVNIRYYEDT